MPCPKCESDDWKSASFVHKSGISDINLNTSGVSVGGGLGTGGIGAGAGLATSKSSGTQQSRLSSETAPPEKPTNTFPIVWLGIALVLSGAASNKSQFLGVIVFLVMTYYGFTKLVPKAQEDFDDNMEKYHKARIRWEATRICQRCGQFYLPEDSVQ